MFGGSRKSTKQLKNAVPLEEPVAVMPPKKELERLYLQLLEELAIPEAKRDFMVKSEDDERKWKLIQAHTSKLEHDSHAKQSASSEPSYWVAIIEAKNARGEPSLTPEKAKELETVLRTGHKQFLTDFIADGGIRSLLSLTDWYSDRFPKTPAELNIIPMLMECYKSLMNNHVGMQGILDIEGSITSLAHNMDLSDLNRLAVAKEVVLLLGATCFYSARGRTLVVNAMDDLRKLWREASRFESLVRAFKQSSDNDFRAATIVFITTIVNSAASVDSRVRVRNDFLALDILDVFKIVAGQATDEDESCQTIATQFQVFEDMMIADHAEVVHNMLESRDGVADDVGLLALSDQLAVFTALRESSLAAGCPELLLELTQLLLLIPNEKSLGAPLWKGITQFVREATSYVQTGAVSAEKKEKAPKLNYQILHGLLDERIKLDKQLSKIADSDDIILKQRKQIEELTKQLNDPKRTTNSQAQKMQEEIDLLRNKSKDLLAEVAALKKANFVLQGELRDANAEVATLKKSLEEIQKNPPVVAAAATAPAESPRASMGVSSAPAGDKNAALAQMLAGRATIAATDPTPVSAPAAVSTTSSSTPAADVDPKLVKYYRMKKSGLPDGAILNAMLRDGVMCPPDFFDDESVAAQAAASSKPKGAPSSASKGTVAKAEDANSNMPQKKPRNPTVPMRGMFWTKLAPNTLEGTIWPELNDEVIKLDIDTLENKFSKPVEKAATLKPGAKTAAAKVEKIHIVDAKRQQNVGITISRFRSSNSEIKKSIMRIDDTILSLERTKALLAVVPTEDEITMLRGYTGDVSLLTEEDQFLHEMTTIPRLEQRLKAALLRLTFDKDTTDIRTKLTQVKAACEEIDKSSELKKLMEIVLAIGNYINGGTPRGGAWGFKIDALAKLETVKENEGRHNLVDYIVHVAQQNYPDVLRFALPKAELAVSLSMTEINKDVNNLSQNMRLLKKELDADHPDKEDRFTKVFGTFELKGQKVISELEAEFHNVLALFQKLVEKFGEKGKMEPQDFFTVFVNFAHQFHECILSIERDKEKEIKAKKMEEQRQALLKMKQKREAEESARGITHQQSSGGVIDQFQNANKGDAAQIVEGLKARYRNQVAAGGGRSEEDDSSASELKRAMARRKQKS